jgi:ADP-dependent phosphofructokinase/glucokinase
LQELVAVLKGIPKTVPVHLEIARLFSVWAFPPITLRSIANVEFVAQIYEQLLPLVDSIGLNEQELSAFVRAKKGRTQS